MEFKLVKLESGVAVFNFEELRDDLVAKLDGYKGYLVTEENLALAKSDRASLNKLAKAIDDKRKEVKKEIMKLYENDFEPQCKELTNLIKNASDEIDSQVKALEERERQAKYEVIVGIWNGLKFDLVQLNRVFQDAWLNKGTTERKIQDDMQNIIATITGNLALLDSTNTPDELKAKYLATLNIELTMAQYRAEQEAKAKLNIIKEDEKEQSITTHELTTPALSSVDVRIIAPEYKLSGLRKVLESNGYSVVQLNDILPYESESKS